MDSPLRKRKRAASLPQPASTVPPPAQGFAARPDWLEVIVKQGDDAFSADSAPPSEYDPTAYMEWLERVGLQVLASGRQSTGSSMGTSLSEGGSPSTSSSTGATDRASVASFQCVLHRQVSPPTPAAQGAALVCN
ncbi:hypothetical protein H4R19_003715 [Coemansia spiralis]|nr:hypothetical protein H4R19_003715 [Coemansia spiralis]